ncbi:MAG: hypothetical protein LKJ80_07645 [Oscillibacter sp.]|jgi:hypothetical protein|nr:hypothetical protein [Oscillibacter sp.]
MPRNFAFQTRQIFFGNLLLILCCAFYLAWWILAFRPANPVRGFQSGWLLLPALAAGIAATVFAARGLGAAAARPGLFPPGWVLWGGAAAYAAALAVTKFLLHRPVTTELLLIVGWAMLALSEVSALFGAGAFTRGTAAVFAAVIAAGTAVSLCCYVLYYRLSCTAGLIDGIVPLAAAALIMAAMNLVLLRG